MFSCFFNHLFLEQAGRSGLSSSLSHQCGKYRGVKLLHSTMGEVQSFDHQAAKSSAANGEAAEVASTSFNPESDF
eukprot:4722319-Amphidinium_carterae.1